MKKIIYNIPTLLCLMLLLLSNSCKKFVSEPYDNRVQLKNVSDYKDLLPDAYPLRHEMFTEIMSDDFEYYATLAQPIMTGYFLPIYQWKDNYPNNRFTNPEKAYIDFYRSIYRANLVINGVMNSTGSNAEKEILLGEALMIRAYSHFMLVNMFAQHYDKATASKDLGTVIVTEISEENTKDYLRSTVEETYTQIEKDALEGISLMEKNSGINSTNPYHFSLASAYALMTREKLYKGEWDEVVKYADKLIALKGRTVRDLPKDLEILQSSGYDFFTVGYMDPVTHPNILLNVSTTGMSFLTPIGYGSSGFYVADAVTGYRNTTLSSTGLYASNDLRDNLMTPIGTVIDSRYRMAKYESQPNNPNTSSLRAAVFTVEEVLLNRAEAIMRSSMNKDEALKDLNAILVFRYSNFTTLKASDFTNESLLGRILLERRREFLGEGMRWFDIKRLNIVVTKILARGVAPEAEGVLAVKDLRRAIQIPTIEIQGNPNIQLNPR